MRIATLALALLLTLTAVGYGENSPTPVARGDRPTIDGTLEPGEWRDATYVRLDPEGEAFLLQDEEGLYVGLRLGAKSIPSLALFRDDKVFVLHASASLGTAEYVRSGKTWRAVRGFTWRCRDGAADEERARFLAEEGWLATTIGDGRGGEAEYRIERRLLDDASLRVALVICRLEPMPPMACAWPETVRDGTREQDLLFGGTPDLDLRPDTWAQIDLGPVGTPVERFEDALDAIEAESDPVQAYLGLLDLLDAHAEAAAGSDRAQRIRKSLEKDKAVAAEAKAQQRLEAALALACRKLREVESRYPGTRAARIARERLEALGP